MTIVAHTCLACLVGACRIGFDAVPARDGVEADANVIPSGRIARLGFDEGSGAVTTVEGVSTTASLTDGAMFVTAGVRGPAVALMTDLSAVDVAAAPQLVRAGDLTVALWYRLVARPSSCATLFIHAAGDTVGGQFNALYALSLDPVNSSVLSFHESGDQVATSIDLAVPATAYEVGRWNHIAMTRSIQGSEIAVYLDGMLSSAANFSQPPEDGSSGTLRIGRDFSSLAGPCGTALPGQVDELYLYGRSLSAAEITQLYEHDRP